MAPFTVPTTLLRAAPSSSPSRSIPVFSSIYNTRFNTIAQTDHRAYYRSRAHSHVITRDRRIDMSPHPSSPLGPVNKSCPPTSAAKSKINARTSLLAQHLYPPHPSTPHTLHLQTRSIGTSSSHSVSSSISHSSVSLSSPSKMASSQGFTTRRIGAPNSLEYRTYIEKDGKIVSPFHDIPLYADEANHIFNMVVEIPRWTNAKMEISKEEPLNPIKQDIKKGKLRYVRNCFPHKGYLWNYGALPQTWEDPNFTHPDTGCAGDNDPIDVCEIGELVGKVGQIKQVKVLGVMALLDEGETDWKVIVVDVNDPLAPKLNNIEDVERHLPGLLRATNEWFRIYKIPDDKPENQFAFTGECKNREYALDVINECADAWSRLIKEPSQEPSISVANTTLQNNATTSQDAFNIPKGEHLAPNPIDDSIDKWFFISGAPNS